MSHGVLVQPGLLLHVGVASNASQHAKDGGNAAPDQEEEDAGNAEKEGVHERDKASDAEAAAKDPGHGSPKVTVEGGKEAVVRARGASRHVLDVVGGVLAQGAPVHVRNSVHGEEAVPSTLLDVVGGGVEAIGVAARAVAGGHVVGVGRGVHIDVVITAAASSSDYSSTADSDRGIDGGGDGGALVNAHSDQGVVDVVKVGVVGHVDIVSVLDSADVSGNVHGVKDEAVVTRAARKGAKASHGHPVSNDEEQAKNVGASALVHGSGEVGRGDHLLSHIFLLIVRHLFSSNLLRCRMKNW
mmetsp:Transcript_24949/g.49673  ORF Transcript_24949/g.49673 Transcript_24949/m.49673 type:complete len:299 (+) Transcript_24949:1471-2367(+)